MGSEAARCPEHGLVMVRRFITIAGLSMPTDEWDCWRCVQLRRALGGDLTMQKQHTDNNRGT